MATTDHEKYPCCGHEHRWLPGAGRWVCTDSTCKCWARSLDELEEKRRRGGHTATGQRSLRPRRLHVGLR